MNEPRDDRNPVAPGFVIAGFLLVCVIVILVFIVR